MKGIWLIILMASCCWKRLMAQRQQPTWEGGFSDQYVSQNTLGHAVFGYNEDHTSGGSFRRETTDQFGNKMGSYGLRVGDGRMRIVNYVADHNGFRADVTSNEPGVASQKSNKYLTVTKKSIYGVLVPGFRYNPHPPHLVFEEVDQISDGHRSATLREEEIYPAAAEDVLEKRSKVGDDGATFEQNFSEDGELTESQKHSSVEKHTSDSSQNLFMNAKDIPQDSVTGIGSAEAISSEFVDPMDRGQSFETRDENITATSSNMLSRRQSAGYQTEFDTGSKNVEENLNYKNAFKPEELETQIAEKSEISRTLESQTETSNTTVTSKEIS